MEKLQNRAWYLAQTGFPFLLEASNGAYSSWDGVRNEDKGADRIPSCIV